MIFIKKKFIEVAINEIDYHEKRNKNDINDKHLNKGTKDYTKYGVWYRSDPGPWCAKFISFCAYHAGIDKNIIPKFRSSTLGMNWFIKNKKFYYSNTYQPVIGDLVFYNWRKSKSSANHVGLVYNVDDKYIYTIEGNVDNMVKKVRRLLVDDYIIGYGTPDYKKEIIEKEKIEHIIYIVKKGDNLTKIAKKYNTTVDRLVRDNNIKNKNLIIIGQKLVIK